MPTSPSIMCCRRARSCNSPRLRKSCCSGLAGSTSNGTATLKQNRFNEANQLQANRFNQVGQLQNTRINNWNNYNGNWGGYYSGLGFGAGLAIGATVAAVLAAAAAISVAGNPYYYANGVYYAPQGGQYAVVAPPQGAVVATPPSSCSNVYIGGATDLDCGGAFYAAAPGGYQVITPPIGATTWTLPNGASIRTSTRSRISLTAVLITDLSTAAAVSITGGLEPGLTRRQCDAKGLM